MMNSLILQNKKILLLSPAFFNYENIIKNKMELMGASVTLYDERAVTSAWDRAILKIYPDIFNKRAAQYYRNVIDQNRDIDYDYILIIKCDMLSVKTLISLKETFPHAKMCLHLWDSVKNVPRILEKIFYFDFASSNDRKDCSIFPELHFRPLFFSDEFQKNFKISKKYLYDISFCGTIHSDRYKILRKIEEQCKDMKLKFYKFLYLQSKFMYYIYKITKKEFKRSMKDDFSFEKKSHSEIAGIEDISKVVLDIQHPAQTGLTMRTIEMVGMRKKIITTNTDIANYDFYNESNICIIDRQNPLLNKDFFSIPYSELPEEIYNKYSLSHWILDVLGIGEGKQ